MMYIVAQMHCDDCDCVDDDSDINDDDEDDDVVVDGYGMKLLVLMLTAE